MSEDGPPGDELLEQVEGFLRAHESPDPDRATMEDVLILEHLRMAVRAARVKGYSADLLVTVLLALFFAERKE